MVRVTSISLYIYIALIELFSPLPSNGNELSIIYPAMNEVLDISDFIFVFVDVNEAGTISSCVVHIYCEDEEDMSLLRWHENFSWVRKVMMPKINFAGSFTTPLVEDGSSPILHITKEHPVALICHVVSLDFEGNELAQARSRFFIRNRRFASNSSAETTDDMERHICELHETTPPPEDPVAHPSSPPEKWSAYRVDQQWIESPSETWEVDPRGWEAWEHDAAVAAACYVFDSHGEAAGACDDGQALAHDFDFPVFVMNLPHRADRRRHTRRLLRNLGFSNVSFPAATRADDLDLSALIRAKTVSAQAPPRPPPGRVRARQSEAQSPRASAQPASGSAARMRRGRRPSPVPPPPKPSPGFPLRCSAEPEPRGRGGIAARRPSRTSSASTAWAPSAPTSPPPPTASAPSQRPPPLGTPSSGCSRTTSRRVARACARLSGVPMRVKPYRS